jgi:hypothetical protein
LMQAQSTKWTTMSDDSESDDAAEASRDSVLEDRLAAQLT